MKRMARYAFVSVVAVGLLAPTGGAQARAASGASGHELAPIGVTRDHSFTGPQLKASSANGLHQRALRPPAAVSARRYAREKAAAERGPAPLGPEVAAGAAPQGESGPLVPSVSLSFNGLDRPGAINNGFVFNPPDTTAAKSPNRVLEGANSALRLSTNAGAAIQTLNLNSFFGASTSNGLLFDPKVFYDRNAANPRFFVVALQVAGRDDTMTSNDVSRIWVAVSRSPDPTGLSSSSWCRYNIDGRQNVGTSNVSWADYPAIGVGRDSFSFAFNQFRFTDRAFTFAVVRVWNKTIAENNAASCPSVPRFNFQPSATLGDFSRFTIQPAQSYTSPSSFTGTTNPAYYMSTNRGSSNQYHVYRVRNVAGGSPTMAQLALTNASYSIPPSSPQPGTSIRVDTGDDRMLQVAGIGNRLVGIFTTACNFTSGTAVESCTRAPRVTVGQNSSGGLTASLPENTFSGFGDNVFVHHASIATNTALQSGTNWESSGSGVFLRSTALIKNVSAGWTTVNTYAPGACSLPATPPSTTTARSGDYSGAQLDPADTTSFWLAGEQAVSIGGSCQWRTRIAHLLP